jgi:transcriptional regulator with AAA-type ATPase domain/transcriptional regulatory protein LevR
LPGKASVAASDEKKAIFDENIFLRKNPSLTSCLMQAKAAVFYPPRGMPILLLGETGVGKSMLAEKIHHIAICAGVFQPTAPCVIFNCADYADNPQLLVGHIFGSKKGAYTGAYADHAGMLESAENGILFLDEVHRLPPVGQEMLFSFIDRGTFRRLGDTEEKAARVQLICATTEEPTSVLLNTFVRRIPMLVRIPNLAQRTEKERFTLINDLFLAESEKIGQPIHATPNAIRCLMTYTCPHNIGQLKADIQILCARAYASFFTKTMDFVIVTSADLPDYIRIALYTHQTSSIFAKLRIINKRPMLCFDASAPTSPLAYTGFPHYSVYDLADDKTQEMKYKGMPDSEISVALLNEIKQYYSEFLRNANQMTMSQLSELVNTDLLATADHVLDVVRAKLSAPYSTTLRNGLAIHARSALDRTKAGSPIDNPHLNFACLAFAEESKASTEALEIMNTELFAKLPPGEAAFLTLLFLVGFQGESHAQNASFHIIVMMHGSRTATALIETVGELLMHPLKGVDPVDIPISELLTTTYLNLKKRLDSLPEGTSVLFLYDMGSISNIVDRAKHEYPTFQMKHCPLASTLHVLEAVQDAELGYSMDYTYNQLLCISTIYYRPLSRDAPVSLIKMSQMLLPVFGSTKAESAALSEKVKSLPIAASMAVVSISYATEKDLANRLKALGAMGRILALISEKPLGVDTPYPNVLWGKDCSGQLEELVLMEETVNNTARSLSNVVKYINIQEAVNLARATALNCARKLGSPIDTNFIICSICHLVCTLERTFGGERTAAPFENRSAYMAKHSKEVQVVQDECQALAQAFGLAFSTDDICAYSLFFTQDVM